MTTKQTAEYNAYTIFLILIAAEEAIAQTLPAFFRYCQTLKGWMTDVDGLKAAAQQSTTGVTADKNKDKMTLLELMLLLTSLVMPYADDTNNTILIDRIKAFPSAFGKIRQNDIGTFCQEILNKITPHSAALADYGVTKDLISEIQALIDSFSSKVPLTRSLIKESTVVTQNRDELFGKMFTLVNKKILESAKGFTRNGNGEFYKKITASLGVDATEPVTTTLRIKIKHTSGKHTAQKLSARIAGTDVHYTANDKGMITMKFEKGGRYDIELPLDGGDPHKVTTPLLIKGRSRTIVIEL